MTRSLKEQTIERPSAHWASTSREQLPMNMDDAAGALKAQHITREMQDGPRDTLGSTDARAGEGRGGGEWDGAHLADAGRIVAARGVGARDLQGAHRAVLSALLLHVLHDLRVLAVVRKLVRRHRLQQAAPPPGRPPLHTLPPTSHTQHPSLFESYNCLHLQCFRFVEGSETCQSSNISASGGAGSPVTPCSGLQIMRRRSGAGCPPHAPAEAHKSGSIISDRQLDR